MQIVHIVGKYEVLVQHVLIIVRGGDIEIGPIFCLNDFSTMYIKFYYNSHMATIDCSYAMSLTT